MVAKNNLTNSGHLGMSGSNNIVCANTIKSNLALVGYNNTFYANYAQGIIIGRTTADAANNTLYLNNFNFLDEALPVGDKTFRVMSAVDGPIFLDNGTVGNYWSDYKGTDKNGDGIGIVPYIVQAKDPHNYHWTTDFNIADLTLTDHYPLMTPFDIDSIIVELPEWANTSPSITPFPAPTPTSPPNTSTSTATPNPTQVTPTPYTTTTPTTTPALTNSTEASPSPSVTQQPSSSTSTLAASGGVGSMVDGLWVGVAVAVVVGVAVGVLFRRKRLGA